MPYGRGLTDPWRVNAETFDSAFVAHDLLIQTALMHPQPDGLAARIRAEYLEMPGLCLSFAQACRLWQIDPANCRNVLDVLMAEQFLRKTRTGLFVALPSFSPRAKTSSHTSALG